MKKHKYPVKMALFVTAYYITNSVFQSYMSLYYSALGFGSARIGTINGFTALSSLAGQPFWGVRADRTLSRRRLIAILALISGGFALAYSFTRHYILLMLLAVGFSFFYTAIQPMGDSVILNQLNESGSPFGPLRLCGCMAFAVSGLIFGRIMDGNGRERLVPILTAVLCAVTAASAFSLPVSPGGQWGGRRMSFKTLIRNRPLMELLLFMTPVQMTMGYFYTFFSPHFMSLEAANGGQLGICYLISAVSEIPFLILSDRLFARFGAGRLMLSAALSLSARWLVLALGHTASAAMFSQIFHGWGYIVMSVCMAKFISSSVPEGLQATGQMLLAIVSFGISRTVGNFGGGLLADLIGRQNVFFACAGICLASACAFAPFCLRRTNENNP